MKCSKKLWQKGGVSTQVWFKIDTTWMKILIKWLFVDGVASLQAAACSPLLTFHKHVCVYVCVCVLHSPWIDRLIKVLVISSTQHIKQEDVAFGSLKTERKDGYKKKKKYIFIRQRDENVLLLHEYKFAKSLCLFRQQEKRNNKRREGKKRASSANKNIICCSHWEGSVSLHSLQIPQIFTFTLFWAKTA